MSGTEALRRKERERACLAEGAAGLAMDCHGAFGAAQ